MTLEKLVETVAEELMVISGNDSFPRDHIEWDLDNENSQFALTVQTVREVLSILDSLGGLVDPETID